MKKPIDTKKWEEAAKNLASKLIGTDIVGTKPQPFIIKEKDKESEAWEKYIRERNTVADYTLTAEEREIVKEILQLDDNQLDNMSIKKYPNGDIQVRTHRSSWTSLAGREWRVNLNEKVARITCMS